MTDRPQIEAINILRHRFNCNRKSNNCRHIKYNRLDLIITIDDIGNFRLGSRLNCHGTFNSRFPEFHNFTAISFW